MISTYRRMFEYDAWANSLVFSSVREQGDAGPGARGLFSHVLASQLIWHSRLVGARPPLDPWSSLTLDQCGKYVQGLPKTWSQYLDGVDEVRLLSSVAYHDTKGQSHQTAVQDILMHVVIHSAYHRGQIAKSVKEIGLTPAVTDFIAYERARHA